MLTMDYSFLDPVRYYLEREGIASRGIRYTEKVQQSIAVRAEDSARVRAGLCELSGGKILVKSVEKGFYGFDIDREGV